MVLDLLAADLERLVLKRPVGLVALGVAPVRHPDEGAQGRHDLRRGDKFVPVRREAVFQSARGLDDHGIAGIHLVRAGCEIIDFSPVAEADADDLDVPALGDDGIVIHILNSILR